MLNAHAAISQLRDEKGHALRVFALLNKVTIHLGNFHLVRRSRLSDKHILKEEQVLLD